VRSYGFIAGRVRMRLRGRSGGLHGDFEYRCHYQTHGCALQGRGRRHRNGRRHHRRCNLRQHRGCHKDRCKRQVRLGQLQRRQRLAAHGGSVQNAGLYKTCAGAVPNRQGQTAAVPDARFKAGGA